MNYTSKETREIANTIAQQFGGAAAFFMIGAKHRSYGVRAGRVCLQFNIIRNATGANACRISYDDVRDLYDMEFVKVPRQPSIKYILNHTPKEIADRAVPQFVRLYEGLYCDTLRETFESATGLCLTMPRVV